jgi:hypothetical protein
VGLTNQIGALVIEGGVQEEALVLDLEVLSGLADAALERARGRLPPIP